MTPHMQKQKNPKLPGNEIFTQFFLSKHSLTDKNIIHKIIVYNEIILVFLEYAKQTSKHFN